MMSPLRCFPALLLLASSLLSCGHASKKEEARPEPALFRAKALRLMEATQLLAEGESSSGPSRGSFDPSPFPVSGFSPATPLALPARTALYINETYGASLGFTYQSFEFSSSACNADNAFDRYFTAIEQLRGSSLSEGERSELRSRFASIYSETDDKIPLSSLCLAYDLMACIADYSLHNQEAFRQASQSGEFSSIFKGAFSCIAEVLGVQTDENTLPTLR